MNPYNQAVIDTIRNRYAQFKGEMPYTETIKFTKDDITMDHDGILIDGIPIDAKAQKSLLSRMKVKPEFISLAEKATVEDWSVIVNNLKIELQDRPYFAKVRRTDTQEEIYSIIDYPVYDKSSILNNDESIDKICDCIEQSIDTWSLYEATFDKTNNKIIIGLINANSKFCVFDVPANSAEKNDIWQGGVKFEFTQTSFSRRHLLERLICQNGMTTKEESFVSHINKNNFNKDKIAKEIEYGFETTLDEVFKKVARQASLLKTKEVSIREFYLYTKPLIKEAKKLEILDDVKAIFDDSVFYEQYGLDVKEQSPKWQGTAKTGFNAYQFFNALTYTISHIFADVSPSVAAKLQLNISKFFFNQEFDIDNIAPEKNIKHNNMHIAFN